MDFNLDTSAGKIYTSISQKMRVLTENWVLDSIFCPSCGNSIAGYENNRPVADFYCMKCAEDFELKSKKGKFGNKITAGAYGKIVERINSPQKPNFFFLGYLEALTVNDFFVVPKHFFIPEILEERKPLGDTARRAGWIGSNILFSKIPVAGHIFYIENGKEILKQDVLDKWNKTLFLKNMKNPDQKGWVLDIMNCIDSLNKKEFTLAEVYSFEEDLHSIHPDNKNIKAKIRQQLQVLRDRGYLEFVDKGLYRLR